MSGALVVVAVLLLAVLPLLVLWIVIEGETANPTVVDRDEAERIAMERGGRGVSQRADDSAPSADERRGRDGRAERDGRVSDRDWDERTD